MNSLDIVLLVFLVILIASVIVEKLENFRLLRALHKSVEAMKFCEDSLAKALYRCIVQKLKLQIYEVDAALDTMSLENAPSKVLTSTERMWIKNRLLELGWMEQGIIVKSVATWYDNSEEVKTLGRKVNG